MLEGITLHPAGFAPMPAVAAILARFDRAKLEAAIEVMIGLLDVADGDPEAQQANGDELDGSSEEDDMPGIPRGFDHPGCEISDPGEDEESSTDTAWIEQVDQTRGQAHRARAVTVADFGTGEAIGVLEDAEDDDAAEDDGGDVDEAHDDGCGPVIIHGGTRWGSEHDAQGVLVPSYGIDQTRGPVSEAMAETAVGNDA